MPTIEILKKLTLPALKAEVRKTNMKKWSSLRKPALIELMLKPEHIQQFHHLGTTDSKKKYIIPSRRTVAEPPKKKLIIRNKIKVDKIKTEEPKMKTEEPKKKLASKAEFLRDTNSNQRPDLYNLDERIHIQSARDYYVHRGKGGMNNKQFDDQLYAGYKMGKKVGQIDFIGRDGKKAIGG